MRHLLAVIIVFLAGTVVAQDDSVAAPAPAINLARTSIAAVGASGVNAKRPLDNEFYGIVKAFDDGGKPTASGITYNYWLAEAGDMRPWVEIRFDVPVEIQEVVAMGAPPFRAEFKWKDQFEFVGKAEASFKPEKPAREVTAVRLTFEAREAPVRVDEIRVLGRLPADCKQVVQSPRLIVSKESADVSAATAFDTWKRSFVGGARQQTTETPEAFITTFSERGLSLVRITVRKSDGKTSIEPLVKLVPVEAGGESK